MNSVHTMEVTNTATGEKVSFTTKSLREGGVMDNVKKIVSLIKAPGCTMTIRTAKGRVLSNIVDGAEMVKAPKHRAKKEALS